MSKPLILITGATGKTGSPVVEQLIERGYPVRALVRRLDERSKRLSELGAEVVLGDFLDLPSLEAAMKGVKRVYFCHPPADGLLESTINLVQVGKEVGLETVVNMSQIEVREGHKSHLANQHWLAEKVLNWSGLGVTHMRPTFFAEMFPIFNGANIATEGKIY
ncbi:NAD(P)H-binding protein, partial [Desulfobacterota bacterium AH_259_B03_O07]|nr:NAD(P)H-binding protein [Desulfobacterota bacterium AH_259_B03_O07]